MSENKLYGLKHHIYPFWLRVDVKKLVEQSRVLALFVQKVWMVSNCILWWRTTTNLTAWGDACDPHDKFTVYSDIPGFITANGGSIPDTMCVTLQKTDVEDIKMEVHIFELTVNWETLCEKKHSRLGFMTKI